MISEQLIGKNVQGSGREIIEYSPNICQEKLSSDT
jgi:hypothetical protein